MSSFNENHPELKDGEKFLTNHDIYRSTRSHLPKSARIGKTAYDVDGNIVYDCRPVFISIKDHDNHMENR